MGPGLGPRRRQRPPLHHQQLLRQVPRHRRCGDAAGAVRAAGRGARPRHRHLQTRAAGALQHDGQGAGGAAGPVLRGQGVPAVRLPAVPRPGGRPHAHLHGAAVDPGGLQAAARRQDRAVEAGV